MIQIYTGEGKGKTTASVGLAVRAKGQGKRVLFVQFLKTEEAGEVRMMETLGIEVSRFDDIKSPLFYPEIDPLEMSATAVQHLWEVLKRANQFDLVVIDEFNNLVKTGILEEQKALEFLKAFPRDTELVITGRGATEGMIEMADYVTYFKMVKHPIQRGVRAREGIEF